MLFLKEGERIGDRCLVTGMAKQARRIVSARTDQRGASDHCVSTRAIGKMRLERVEKPFQTPCLKGTSEEKEKQYNNNYCKLISSSKVIQIYFTSSFVRSSPFESRLRLAARSLYAIS